jgi:small-conductance mechanosensitive channel
MGIRIGESVEGLRETLGHIWLDLEDFYVQHQHRLLQQAILLLVLLAILIALRRRVRSAEIDDDAVARFRGMLDAPLPTALTISIALALLFYPKAPPTVIDVLAIVIFFPLLRVLRSTITPAARFRFVLVWLLFILDRSGLLFDADTPTPRVILLIESGLGLAFLMRVRSTGAEVLKGRSDVLRGVGRFLLLVFIAQLTVSLVANVIGYVSLAGLLTGSVIISLYLAAVLFGLFPAVQGLVELTPELGLLQRLRLFQRHRDLLQERAVTALRWVFFLVWLYSYIELLNLLPSIGLALGAVLNAAARFGELEISVRDVLAFVITIWAAVLISRFLRFVLEEYVYHRLALPRGVPHAISTGLNYTILFAGFVLAVAATGIDLSRVTLLVGAFGVGIGFGLQNVVNNFVSGIILIAERPVMPGDIIELNGLYGEVKRIGMRSSTVRTWEGAEVIVPNGELISRQVTNWTLSDRMRRVDVEVGVAYGTDPDLVQQVLQRVADEHPDGAKYPRPTVLCLGYGDSAILYAVRLWTRFDDFIRVRSELTVAVGKALREAEITIPFPQRDLHVRSVNPQATQGLRREDGEGSG